MTRRISAPMSLHPALMASAPATAMGGARPYMTSCHGPMAMQSTGRLDAGLHALPDCDGPWHRMQLHLL